MPRDRTTDIPHTSPIVVSLDAVRLTDAPLVGTKAATLGTLREAGFPVPPGLCVTTAAFRLALEPYQDRLTAIGREYDLAADPSGAHAAAGAIASTLADLTIPTTVRSALRAALPAVISAHQPAAVRSSATAEDRDDVSFAGQYATIIGVRGEDAIADAILTCWRSFFSAHALVARAKAGALAPNETMAVLVQPAIDAECAGVCFSVDPVRSRRDTVVMNAAWGLGIGVVDGSVRTDSARLDRNTLRVEDHLVAEKLDRIGLTETGVARLPVDAERHRAACLPASWLKRVAQFGIAAELLLGRPQDLEWAIADDRFWVLQSRPITGLPAELEATPPFPVNWPREGDERRFWWIDPDTRGTLPLPLEAEVSDLFKAAQHEAAAQNGADVTRLTTKDRRVRLQRFERFNGRRYVCEVPLDLREGDLRARLEAGRDLCRRLRDEGITRWEYRAPEVVAATRRLATFDVVNADGPKLAEHLEEAFGVFLHHWVVHWTPSGGEVMLAPYREALARVSGLTGPAAEALSAQIVAGEPSLLTEIVDRIYELALLARQVPSVASHLAVPADDTLARLSELPEAQEFLTKLDAFLERFGDRSGSGFGSANSILNPTWREKPELVLRLVAQYLDGEFEPPALARERAQRQRDEQVAALCAACPDGDAVSELRRWLPYARRTAADLENHNHYIDQLSYGQLRRAILASARWLVLQGALEREEDVFWLHRDEIVTALREATTPALRSVVAERQAQHRAWSDLVAPPILGVPSPELDPRPPLKDEVTTDQPRIDNRLVGTPASRGRRRGRARVIPVTTIAPDVVAGDVLVAENAGPMWTPFFPVLAGIVLDHGVLTQHAATTAREYGIPAVIETNDATRRIPDGAWVTVDGTTGIVELD